MAPEVGWRKFGRMWEMEQSPNITVESVRRVAHLSRLAVTDGQLAAYAGRLGAVLSYVDRLRELDLEGVEPMAHPGDATNRLQADEPAGDASGPERRLGPAALMRMAPASMAPFVKVPKVLGDEGGV